MSGHGVLGAEVGEVGRRRRRRGEPGQRPARLEARRELGHLRWNTHNTLVYRISPDVRARVGSALQLIQIK